MAAHDPPPLLRDARAADGPSLTTMVRTSGAYDGAYRVMVAPLLIDFGYLERNPARVAVDIADQPVAFYSLLIPGRGALGEAELDYLFVADDRQRRGIGRLLAADLLDMATLRGWRRIHIVSHPPSEGFYRAIGARPVGHVPPKGRITWPQPVLVLDPPRAGRADVQTTGARRRGKGVGR